MADILRYAVRILPEYHIVIIAEDPSGDGAEIATTESQIAAAHITSRVAAAALGALVDKLEENDDVSDDNRRSH